MLFSGLRSAEVLALTVADVDIARGWARVTGKGGRERRVPVDAQVAGWIQTYLLAERPDTDATALFVVAKGPHRGRPLTPAGLRTIFRYHRDRAGVPAAHPHALRHSFGTALAEAGVDLGGDPGPARARPRRLPSVGYIHLAPVRVRAAYDTARDRQRRPGAERRAAPRPARPSWSPTTRRGWPATGAAPAATATRPGVPAAAGPTRAGFAAEPLDVQQSWARRSGRSSPT